MSSDWEVQDRTGSSYDAAAEQRSLGKWKLLGNNGNLVVVDEGLFGEAAEPEELEQASSISGQARGVGRSAEGRLRMLALEGAAGQTPGARPRNGSPLARAAQVMPLAGQHQCD